MKKTHLHSSCLRGFVGQVGLFLLVLFFILVYFVYLSCQADFLSTFRLLFSQFYFFISSNVWVLLLALFFLPTFGIPVSPLFVLVGATLGIKLGLLASCIAIGFNLSFSYIFYKKCLNPFFLRLILRKKSLQKINLNAHLSSLRWVLLIQLIPQIPYAVQCYILASLQQVNFWHYLGVSWVIQFLWAVGFVCGGQAILSQSYGLIWLCIGLFLVYWLHKKFRHYRQEG